MSNYKFGGGSQKPIMGVLPEGDYSFTVLECDEPYLKDNGHWVLRVKLGILPGNDWVWAAPWSGETSAHEERDGIGDFLLSVNRATAIGKEPDYRRVIGAKGRCRLKIGKDLKDNERNEVAFFHVPKQVGPTAEPRAKSYSDEEVNEARKRTESVARGKDPDLNVAPDDIPF